MKRIVYVLILSVNSACHFSFLSDKCETQSFSDGGDKTVACEKALVDTNENKNTLRTKRSSPIQANNLPLDTGVKIQRHLTNYTLDRQGNTGYTNDFTQDGNQPIVSWDGLLYLRQSGFRSRNGTTYKAGGLAAYVIDYKNSFRDAEDRLELLQTSQYSNGNQGVLVYKHLYYGESGSCHGQYLYEVPQGGCNGTNWRITMDDAANSPLGVGTGLNYLWHASIVPSPERTGENPFLSDAQGNPVHLGTTNYMTYEYLLIASAVRSPELYDADANSSHPLYGLNQVRDRIVVGLGKIIVEFESAPGGHRVPVKILGGEIDRESFTVIETEDSYANGNSIRILRGIEPTVTRDGNIVLFHSNLTNHNGRPGSASPGTEHILYTHRIQGNFFDPKCLRGTPNCVPLRFKYPRHATSMYSDRTLTVPGENVSFGQKYPLFRHKIMSPTGDHIYQPGTPLGMAYPWIQLDGQFMTGTTSRGTGDFLDLTPLTSLIHTNGGIEYCLNNGCQSASSNNSFSIRRESQIVLGNRLVATNSQGEKYFQMQILDNPINEARRTIARVTSGTLGMFGGLWSASNNLPVDHMEAFKITPGDNVFPTIISANNWSNSVGYLGRRQIHMMGQVNLEGQEQDYILNSGLIPSGDFRSQYAGSRNEIRSNFESAQDISGNNLEIALSYNVNTGGAFYPYNDPITSFHGPLGDNERQIMVGRNGQGVTCTADGEISITEGSMSRGGALSDYSETISVQMWFKPLKDKTIISLASSPAYELVQYFDDRLYFAVKAAGNSGHFTYVVVGTDANFQKGEWYHIAAQSYVLGTNRVVELHINGQLNRRYSKALSSLPGRGLYKGTGAWRFCPGGQGTSSDKIMMVDEIKIANRHLRPKEIRIAALKNDPIYEQSQKGPNRLEGINRLVTNRGFDAKEFFVPSSNIPSKAKVRLGEKIFFDRRLSSDGTVACASCHSPSHAFGSPFDHGKGEGVGGQIGTRVPSRLQNIGFHRPEDSFSWDGRATSLEDQVTRPFSNPAEMGFTEIESVIKKITNLGREYSTLVKAAFGQKLDQLSEQQLSYALASYVRTLVVGNAPYDHFRKGDTEAFTPAQRRGFGIFKMNCTGCHSGADLSDNKFHNIGLYDPRTHAGKDSGRMAVTGSKADFMAFKTPGLRNLRGKENTLGHDGTKTLDEIIDNYSDGGTHRNHFDNVATTITALGLTTSEKLDLKDFLLNGLVSK